MTASNHEIAAALQRVQAVLQRRPESGLHDDSPATARWQRGMRVVTSHANGTELATDMPAELGGSGDKVTPGWLFRAGVASCAVTTLAMVAVEEGIELSALEVRMGSRSDSRGLMGVPAADGTPVYAGPASLTLQVRIAAEGVEPARLRKLVADAMKRSPIPNAVEHASPYGLQVEVG